ncbi:MAG: hypothetical protein SFU27_09160 [Thermonemataceae bacterium]|nr:hypothetical protein [Thermonemataceae bacterium]
MKKIALFSFFVLFLLSCSKVQDGKLNKTALQMNGDYRSLPSLRLEPRYDIAHDSLSIKLRFNNGNSVLARHFKEIVALQKELNKPIEELPPLATADSRIWQILMQYEGQSVYQDFANWASFGMLKAYFLRMPNLNENEKIILAKYLNVLITQKNVNLTELSQGLQKIDNAWTNQQKKNAAQTILNYYPSYVEGIGKLDSLTDNADLNCFLESLREDLEADERAKASLQQIIATN